MSFRPGAADSIARNAKDFVSEAECYSPTLGRIPDGAIYEIRRISRRPFRPNVYSFKCKIPSRFL